MHTSHPTAKQSGWMAISSNNQSKLLAQESFSPLALPTNQRTNLTDWDSLDQHTITVVQHCGKNEPTGNIECCHFAFYPKTLLDGPHIHVYKYTSERPFKPFYCVVLSSCNPSQCVHFRLEPDQPEPWGQDWTITVPTFDSCTRYWIGILFCWPSVFGGCHRHVANSPPLTIPVSIEMQSWNFTTPPQKNIAAAAAAVACYVVVIATMHLWISVTMEIGTYLPTEFTLRQRLLSGGESLPSTITGLTALDDNFVVVAFRWIAPFL